MLLVKESRHRDIAITDRKILRYIDECIANMKQLRFGFKNEEQILTYDDIDIKEGKALHIFGSMKLPSTINGNFKLIINKYSFAEPEEVVKNTIYHELCHYVVDKLAISLGIFYYKDGRWYNNRADSRLVYFSSHGQHWKNVANAVGRAFKQNISRTGSFDLHTEVGAHTETKYNYIIKCKHCEREFKYAKKSKFVAAVLAGGGITTTFYCKCPDGTKGRFFDIVKGNNL